MRTHRASSKNAPTWQIRIADPSGGVRVLPLALPATLGRSPDAAIALLDPTAGAHALSIIANPAADPQSSPFWLKAPESALPVRLGDLTVRDACLPPGVPVFLGETRIVIEKRVDPAALPEAPANVRPWLTVSPQGRQTLWMAKRAASTPLSIYLAGETGAGKEVLAHLLHAWSPRAGGPFVPLHCAALPLSLIESELFGHVKGAFTGAHVQRPGALMQAHGGTLFLDEIGDLPMDIQIKLLRFLENGEIRPVGSDRVSRADVRLVCATHRSLLQLVEEGKFRQDLYYRLASVTIEIPPLRNRPEDIEMLAMRFASDLQRTLSPRAVWRLQAHDWPGNVRELRHAIERASGLADAFSTTLEEDAFEFLLTPDNVTREPCLGLGIPVLKLEEMERAMILKALRLSRGNRSTAAEILGVARSTLFEMIKRHRIPGAKAGPMTGSGDDSWRAAEA